MNEAISPRANGMCTFRMKAKSEAYARSEERSSFRACSRLVTIGMDAAKVESFEDIEVFGAMPMVAVGELDPELLSGGDGRGLSSESMKSSASISDVGLGGTAGVDKCSWSSRAVNDATLLFFSAIESARSGSGGGGMVSRFEYRFTNVVNDDTLFVDGRRGDRGGGGGGSIDIVEL